MLGQILADFLVIGTFSTIWHITYNQYTYSLHVTYLGTSINYTLWNWFLCEHIGGKIYTYDLKAR